MSIKISELQDFLNGYESDCDVSIVRLAVYVTKSNKILGLINLDVDKTPSKLENVNGAGEDKKRFGVSEGNF